MRVVELINHYPDDAGEIFCIDNITAGKEVKYCAFGYYDAVEVNLELESSGVENRWERKNRATLPYLTGSGKITSLCMLGDHPVTEKEKALWRDNSEKPLLAISLIRTKSLDNIEKFVEQENAKEGQVAYCSYEHCEVVIVFRESTYRELIARIRSFSGSGYVAKIYTVLAISDDLLKQPDEIKRMMPEERVNIRLSATVKDRSAMELFFAELKRQLCEGESEPPKVGKYDLLGNDDLLIEINAVYLYKILPLYAENGLLAHGNKELYRNAFYNIESRFLVPYEDDIAEKTSEYSPDYTGTGKESDTAIDWIYDRIKELKEMCAKEEYRQEEALVSYMICMVKLLNGLVQAAASDFHRYERRILVKPIKLFLNHFIEAVKNVAALQPETLQEKDEMLDGIEHAVCRVSDIYENVLNATANSDKQMFLSFPVNSSIYEISPKLYAFYADLIDNLTKLFDSGGQYAFLLNSTLKRTLQEEVLFENREEHGKVVVIDIPVRMMEDTGYLSMAMIHEVFHVLTADQRNRRYRAVKLMPCLYIQLDGRIFEGVRFHEDDSIDRKLRDRLLSDWLSEADNAFGRLCQTEDEYGKRFYGKNISAELCLLLEQGLLKVENYDLRNLLTYYQEIVTDGSSVLHSYHMIRAT